MYNEKALKELKSLLISKFPEYIDKLILFGSRAENKEQEYSDYDILLILKKDYNWKLKENIREIVYDIILKYDIITETKFISKKELNSIKGCSPFIQDALLKGIII